MILALAALLALPGGGAVSPPAQAQVFTEPPAARPSTRPRPRPSVAPRPKRPAPEPRREVRERSFTDPAAYCAAHPDAEIPAPPYSGPPVPQWLSTALAAARGPQSGPEPAYSWRCMGGRVLACASTVSEDRCARPSQEREPASEITEYCADRRKGEVPAAITGNTVPIWTCRNRKPAIAGYRPGLDAQGYLGGDWTDLTDLAPGNAVGAVPRGFLGTWSGRFGGTSLLGVMPFVAVFRITGGQASAPVGTLEYYLQPPGQAPQLGCAVDLILQSSQAGALVTHERTRQHGTVARCGAPDRVTLQSRDGQLFVEWRNTKNNKVRVSGWVQRTGAR